MIDISKITREDRLTLPNKNELLKKRREWLKKERKEARRITIKEYTNKLRELGYRCNRVFHSNTIIISKYNYLKFTVSESKSGETMFNCSLYTYEPKVLSIGGIADEI